MEMSGEQHIPVPQQRVWEALNDPEILRRCIPGCQSLEMASPTEMSATVVLNVTVVTPQASGDVVLYPAGTGVPNASSISFRAGRTRANNAFVLLAADGTGRAAVKSNAAGALDLVIDVNGYYE